MSKVFGNLVIKLMVLILVCVFYSCEKKPLTIEGMRENFIRNVAEEVKMSSVKIDFRIEGTTIYMIDKSETATGLMILKRSLEKNGVWVEDPNNTMGHLGSSLMKLGFTHYVWWGSKDNRIYKEELKYRPYKPR